MKIEQIKCEVCGKREDIISDFGMESHSYITIIMPRKRTIPGDHPLERESFDVCGVDCLQKLVQSKGPNQQRNPGDKAV